MEQDEPANDCSTRLERRRNDLEGTQRAGRREGLPPVDSHSQLGPGQSPAGKRTRANSARSLQPRAGRRYTTDVLPDGAGMDAGARRLRDVDGPGVPGVTPTTRQSQPTGPIAPAAIHVSERPRVI